MKPNKLSLAGGAAYTVKLISKQAAARRVETMEFILCTVVGKHTWHATDG